MKNIFRLAAATLVLSTAVLSEASAQATATATASANIVTPISIAQVTNLQFGNVAVSATLGGDVIINTSGVRSSTFGVTLPATTGTVTAASFTVSGHGSYTYAITLPASVIITNGSSVTMLVDDFVSSPNGTGTLSAGGTQTLNIGATLEVAAAQASGAYLSATPFSVTVNYN